MTQPDFHIPDGFPTGDPPTLIVVPFVPGMLREQTMAAVTETGMAYITYPIDPLDTRHYAEHLRSWWKLDMDLIIVEQDMVPTVGQFRALADHPDDWVAIPYHSGEGRYITGLGFCKISAALRRRWPDAGVNISLDPRGNGDLVEYLGLNEAVERHLTRLGETQTVLGETVVHLHHPAASDA